MRIGCNVVFDLPISDCMVLVIGFVFLILCNCRNLRMERTIGCFVDCFCLEYNGEFEANV